jgi:hypothetical protein
MQNMEMSHAMFIQNFNNGKNDYTPVMPHISQYWIIHCAEFVKDK